MGFGRRVGGENVNSFNYISKTIWGKCVIIHLRTRGILTILNYCLLITVLFN